MKIIVAQLHQTGSHAVIAPQTTEEAVLVQEDKKVITLKDALNKKIEHIITPVGSGLKALQQDKNVIITHTNTITPNPNLQCLKLQYDTNGHIIKSSPIGNIKVTVNSEQYLTTDSSEDQEVKFGDDFAVDIDKNIKLTWKNE